MATKKKPKKGIKMRKGAGWKFTTPGGKVVTETLLETFNFQGKRLVVFSAPER